MGEHCEVGPVHVGENIRTEDRLAFSIANAHVGNRCATIGLHDPTVLIFKNRNPKRTYSLEQGLDSRARIVQGLDKYRSAGSAMSGIGCTLPVLDAAISIKHRFIGPDWVCRFRCK